MSYAPRCRHAAMILPKMVLWFAVFFAGMVIGEPDVLESACSLGRITGPGVANNTFGLSTVDNEAIFADNLFTQIGKENSRQFGFSLLGEALFGSSGGLMAGLEGFDCAFQPADASRIRFGFQENLLQFGFAIGTPLGLIKPTNPFLNGNLNWDLLSRHGQVAVDSQMYDLAFYCGPQVNQGQFGFRSGLQLLYYELNEPYSDFTDSHLYGGAYLVPVIGITDNLQISGRVAAVKDAQSFSLSLPVIPCGLVCDYRMPAFQITSGWQYEQNPSMSFNDWNDPYFNILFMEGIYVSGHHISSLAQVRGNWNGYFSDQLSAGQFLSKSFVSVPFAKAMQPALEINETAAYGLSPAITAGSSYQLIVQKHSQPSHDLRINATLSNIPFREKGPSEVSKYEYEFGYLPRPGEFKVNASYRVPFYFGKFYYGGFMYDDLLQSYTNFSSMIDNRTSFFDQLPATTSAESMESTYHFSAKAQFGASLPNGFAFILGNQCGLTKINYLADSVYTSGDIASRALAPSWVLYYYDGLSIAFPGAQYCSAFSLGLTLQGNTDPLLSGPERFTYGVFFNYAQGI